MSIYIEEEGGSSLPFDTEEIARTVVEAALEYEKCPYEAEVTILLTTDEEVRKLNCSSRGLDRPTDVLSFPMFQFQPGQLPEDWEPYIDPESQLVPLGDMAISLERAKAQAKEYGHSVNREVGYLTVHSVLHLLGYDHLDEGPMKRQMRSREEAILAEILLPR